MMAEKSFTAPINQGLIVSQWGLFVGYLLPLGLLAGSFFLFKGDLRELIIRYKPVMVAVGIDFFLGFLHVIFPKHFSADLYYHRISNILFRFFYFIPFLYFCSIPKKNIQSKFSNPLNHFLGVIRLLFRTVFYRYRVAICACSLSVIGMIMIFGAVNRYSMHKTVTAQAMKPIMERIELAKEIEAPGIVAYELIGANLIAPTLTARGTLLPSVFGNFVDDKVVIERLVLFAKIYGWDKDRFIRFMNNDGSFPKWKHKIGSQIPLAASILDDGLGYWLVNHNQKMDKLAFLNFQNRINIAYRNLQLDDLLARYPLAAVITDSIKSIDVNASQVLKENGVKIHCLTHKENVHE
jgi:hypothetical protein